MDDDFKPLLTVRRYRGQTAELVAYAVALALAINLLSGAISALGALPQAGLGLALAAATLLYVRHRYLAPQRFQLDISATVVTDDESHDLVPMPGYAFSEDTSRLYKAVCAENSALKRQWHDDPLGNWWRKQFESGAKPLKRGQSDAGKILLELTEYSILHKLSMKIGDYYNLSKIDKKQLEVISRANALELLHGNRVLEALSREPKDRATFGEAFKQTEPKVGQQEAEPFARTVFASGAGGALYNLFKFKLPKGGSLDRTANGFTISTPQISVTISVKTDEFAANLPREYNRLILKRSVTGISSFEILISIDVVARFSLRHLKDQQVAYGWIDSFVGALRADYSAEHYFSSLNWPNVLATVRALEPPPELGIKDSETDQSDPASPDTLDPEVIETSD